MIRGHESYRALILNSTLFSGGLHCLDAYLTLAVYLTARAAGRCVRSCIYPLQPRSVTACRYFLCPLRGPGLGRTYVANLEATSPASSTEPSAPKIVDEDSPAARQFGSCICGP